MSSTRTPVDLRQLRKQAKDLHRATQADAGADDILARIRQHHPKFAQATSQKIETEFSLQEAQHVIARELGHESWPKLVAAVEGREAADRDGRFTTDELRGLENLHEALAEGVQQFFRQAGAPEAEIRIQYVDQVTWAEFLGSRSAETWTYSYTPRPLEGGAAFDFPKPTAEMLARLAEPNLSPTFLPELLEVVTGRRAIEAFSSPDHLRFIVPLLESGLEAAWGPVMPMDMAEIMLEPDPVNRPRRHVAELSDVVGLVALAIADDEVVMRACYPYKTLGPQLGALGEFGRRGSV